MTNSGKKIFTLNGFAIFENNDKYPGSLFMNDQKGIISFQWQPDKADTFDYQKQNIEEAPIFIFLHLIKKIIRTKEENSTQIRFNVPEVRTNIVFSFPETQTSEIDQIFGYLLTQNSITLSNSDPITYNINLECDKSYNIPENHISLTSVVYIQILKGIISKILDEVPKTQRKPVDMTKFNTYFDINGHIRDIKALKNDVFVNGLSDDARPLAYLYLFDVYKPNFTKEENADYVKSLFKEYQLGLHRWRNQIPGQEEYAHNFYGVITSDVRRTDRTQSLFEIDGPAHKALKDILVCYALEVADVGYIQGMSDLAATMMQTFYKKVTDETITLFDDRVLPFDEANNVVFWVFYGFLKLTGHDFMFKNIDTNRNFIAERIFALAHTHLSPVTKWLASIDQTNILFTLSPTLLLFRRWFNLGDLYNIWDRLFAHEDPPSYLRFIIAATLGLALPCLMTSTNNGGDVSASFCKALSSMDPFVIIDLANAIFAKAKSDEMHTQWIFMKYPEDVPDIDFIPKYIKIVD